MKNQKHAKNKKNNLMLNLLIIICIIAILFSLYNIAHWILENKNGNTMLSTIQKQITISSEDVTIDNHTVKKIKYDFTNLLSTNPHTIGWINLPNTNIDYPIVKYTDNDYYLNHSFDGSENSAGWVFADYQNKCDGTDYNTVTIIPITMTGIWNESCTDSVIAFTCGKVPHPRSAVTTPKNAKIFASHLNLSPIPFSI